MMQRYELKARKLLKFYICANVGVEHLAQRKFSRTGGGVVRLLNHWRAFNTVSSCVFPKVFLLFADSSHDSGEQRVTA